MREEGQGNGYAIASELPAWLDEVLLIIKICKTNVFMKSY